MKTYTEKNPPEDGPGGTGPKPPRIQRGRSWETTEGGILMYRVDVWYRPWGCFCPGVNTYPTKAQADDRAAAMRAVGHRVKVVSATAKKYTSK